MITVYRRNKFLLTEEEYVCSFSKCSSAGSEFQQVKIGHKAGPAIFNNGKSFSSENTSRKIFQY